jgi:seryl-tRNA synthetase
MTQEQDIVERLLAKASNERLYGFDDTADLVNEAAQTIAALRAERDGLNEDTIRLHKDKMDQWERAEAAEARVKELEAEISNLDAKLDHVKAERDLVIKVYNIAQEQLDTAIRERDEARMALEPFAKLYDTEEVSDSITDTVLFGLKVSDLHRARSVSSNREGEE